MSDIDVGGGLRERKKRATQQAIERSAVELALEHGYENVTVEMICDSVVISQRTFFNYAGSKERAVLGLDAPFPDDKLRRAFIAGLGGSPLEDLIATISAAFSNFDGENKDLFHKRRQVLQANPELVIKEFARMEEARHSIFDLVRERLCADTPDHAEGDLDGSAGMVVSLTFGIMHFTLRDRIFAGTDHDPTDSLERAVELARQVING